MFALSGLLLKAHRNISYEGMVSGNGCHAFFAFNATQSHNPSLPPLTSRGYSNLSEGGCLNYIDTEGVVYVGQNKTEQTLQRQVPAFKTGTCRFII